MEDINRLFSELKEAVERFYQKNADLDASGIIHLEPVQRATKRLDLYLAGDFETLWRMECENTKRMQDDMEETFDFMTTDNEASMLRRELLIMTRCAKRMMDAYKKECMEHEATKVSKIDDPPPLESGTENHVHPP